MDSVNIKVTRSPRLIVPDFNSMKIAEAIKVSMNDRILRGYNSLDQPSKPLTFAYARSKVRSGAKGIRDWVKSFALMSSFGVQSEDGKTITVGWPADQQDKVRWNQKKDDMASLSPNDRQAGQEASQESFAEFLKDIWRK